jgi:hypothetical protein
MIGQMGLELGTVSNIGQNKAAHCVMALPITLGSNFKPKSFPYQIFKTSSKCMLIYGTWASLVCTHNI